MADKKPVAVLTLVVEYNDFPSDECLDSIVMAARGEGILIKALLQITSPTSRNLLEEY